MSTLVDQFRMARLKSTPLIGITTPDPGATITMLVEATNGSAPMLEWDAATGMRASNERGRALIEEMFPGKTAEDLQKATARLEVVLQLAQKFPSKTALFIHNAGRFLQRSQPIVYAQSVWNLRDPFKADFRSIILLGPSLDLPPELVNDVVVFDEPLPTPEQLQQITTEYYAGAREKAPELLELSEDVLTRTVDALRGTPTAFMAEQLAAINLKRTGFDLPALWEHKRRIVEQTKGLTADRGRETFDDIGGLAQIKAFSRGLFTGGAPPRCIVRLDELEKAMAGAGHGAAGDSSGVSQDALGVVLREMEDNDWSGLITVGAPGTGKSLLSKALSNTFDVLSLGMDLGGMKGRYVGDSEGAIRQAMKTVKAVAGGNGAFFIACCNRLDSLPPELRRRFRLGIWYLETPDAQEREAIWRINIERYKLVINQNRPDDSLYVGSDIRNVCDIAWRLNCSLVDASQYIVPVAKSDPDAIERLRNLANGRFLSASYPGVYRYDRAEESASPMTTRRRARAATV